MIIKMMQHSLKVILLSSFLILGFCFSVSLIAADEPRSGQRVGLGNQDSANSTDSSVKVDENKAKASSQYIDPKVLQEQNKEEEKKNKELRQKNEIGTLYSDEYRKQNNDDASFFEEEILKSQINDTGVFLNDGKLNSSSKGDEIKIQAVQEGVLADYKKDSAGKDKKILDFKNPIFFVSEGVDSFSYTNTMDLCNIINLGARTVDCLVYPESNVSNIASILRRGQKSDFYDKTGVNADFIIVRDDVYSQYKKGRGSLALAPDLDLMMYLNGDYLFMFANSMSNTFSFEHLSAKKRSSAIKVGYINQQSRVIFERTLAKIYPEHAYVYQNIDVSSIEAAKNSICNPTDIDVFIFFGGKLPDNLAKAMEECSSVVNPLTLSDGTLAEVVKLTDFFSVANIVGYYPVPSVLNYLDIYLSLERSYAAKKGSMDSKLNLEDYSDKADAVVSSTNSSKKQVAPLTERERELIARRQRAEQLKKRRDEERTRRINELKKQREERKAKEQALIERKKSQANNSSKWGSFLSFLNFSSKSDVTKDKAQKAVYLNQELVIKEESLDKIKGRANNNKILGYEAYTPQVEKVDNNKGYVTASTAIKTFGIRYVLLSSRYAKRENVINVFDSVIKDYFLLRDSILTPDMAKFNISDIILGTQGFLVANNYHPALSKYPSYLLENKNRKTPEQTVAIKILSLNSKNVRYPNYFGPASLSTEQMDTLYTKARELNKRKEELAAIRIFQRDTTNIDQALTDIRNGKTSSDSLLKATGLDYVNAILDEQSVLTQGMIPEEKLSPDAMKELEKLSNENNNIPVKQPSAEDVKKAVEGKECTTKDANGKDIPCDNSKTNDNKQGTEKAKPAVTSASTDNVKATEGDNSQQGSAKGQADSSQVKKDGSQNQQTTNQAASSVDTTSTNTTSAPTTNNGSNK